MSTRDSSGGLALAFRRMQPEDLRVMHEWLQRPHVRRWWRDRDTYEQVVEHYLPAIEGRDPTDLYVVELDGRSIGCIQTYRVSDYPGHAEAVGVGEGAAGVDLFIGQPQLTGQGIGTAMLRRFVREVVFADPSTSCCIADPEVENVASMRAFENAGFRVVKEFVDPGDGRRHAVLRLDRD